MTALDIITLSSKMLTGLEISDITDATNKATLLSYLNLAKGQLAVDTHMWLGGETIDLIDGTYEYTLSKIPVTIIDVYDDSNTLRLRNSPNSYGYFQTSPNTIHVNSPDLGSTLYMNYYYEPDDYLEGDTVAIPSYLINALTYFVAHKAYEEMKSDSDRITADNYLSKYISIVDNYKETNDTDNTDSVVAIDKITDKGFV